MVSSAKKLIWIELLYLMLSGLLIPNTQLLRVARYLLDPLTLLLLLCILLSGRSGLWNRLEQVRVPLITAGVWLVYMLVGSCFKSPQLLPILWALRNWLRGFVLLSACAIFLERQDVFRFYRLFQGLYWVNFAATLVQYFLFDLSRDDLGGIFGSLVGCNGYTNIFLCIMVTAELCLAFQDGVLDFFGKFVLLSSTVIAAMTELKIFYLEYLFIVGAVCLLFALRKKAPLKLTLRILFWAAVGFGLGMWVIYRLFPRHFAVLIGQKSYAQYEETCRVAYKISRVHFIQEINEFAFHGSPHLNLFGFGFGSCEYSNFSFLSGSLYSLYEDMKYHYCTHHTLFLEGGLVGLGLYLLIPLSAAAYFFRQLLCAKTKPAVSIFGITYSLLLAVNILYNNAFRTEISYLIWFTFAAVFLLGSRSENRERL